MPGIVVFRRRWSVGSDDLVVPALFLVTLHIIWIIVLAVILSVVEFDRGTVCAANLHDHVLGYLVILSVCVVVEGCVAFISMRGTILETQPRASMQYLLYIRLAILLIELSWLVVGVVWVSQHYQSCTASSAKRAILGIIVCNWAVMLSVLISLWCTFDTAGRSWVKMKRYQASVKERETRAGHKHRSGSRRRNWRNRKAMRKYEASWDRRCNILFCCVREDRHQNSFTEVAKLFTEFFRDLDVVPSDIVAGLVLLRKYQKLRRSFVVSQDTNDVYQFLSGVPVTPRTQFLSLQNPDVLADYKQVVYYMRYALAAYGWPMYIKMHTATGLCRIMPNLGCCRCCTNTDDGTVVEDNCCHCNLAALQKMIGVKDIDLIYVTYHVDIGETPFYIAVDHAMKKVVISIRGTLSLQDVLTDLKADAEQLPVNPPKEDWLAHKGMVQAANYIRKKIREEMLLAKAFGKDLERGTQDYELVCVGHSLGAGTAAILAIMLHQEYPNLLCYSYSPPGGLLSATCVEDTKSFITSVVVGKDVVPRIGLFQLEALRQDLINVIKQSNQPKWKLITSGILCCCKNEQKELSESQFEIFENLRTENENRYFAHPSDSQVALTSHTPLFLPGKIIHVVRNHPKDKRHCRRAEPVYQAIWAENKDFDKVLISPTMVNDHMPDNVLEALEKVLTNVSPAKPTRKLAECERKALLTNSINPADITDTTLDSSNCPHCLCQEATHIHDDSGTPVDPTLDQEQIIAPTVTFNLGTESNSLSWDYATMPMDHSKKHALPESVSRAERTRSFPPPLQKLRPGVRIDELGNPEWSYSGLSITAPLASPETLSEASSLDTMSSKRYSRSSITRLDPIPPSPLRPAHTNGYHYFVPAPSPVDYADSPREEFSTLSGSLQDCAGVTDIVMVAVNTTPLAQSTPIKPEVLYRPVDSMSTLMDLSDSPLYSHIDGTPAWDNKSTGSGDLGVKPLCVQPVPECIINITDFDQTNLTDIELRIEDKLQDIELNDPYKLTYGDTVMMDSDSEEDFVLHSPDSLSNQCLYDDYGGHYSPAGRGYPHGGYMGRECIDEHPVSRESYIDIGCSPGESLAEIRNSPMGEPPSIIDHSLVGEAVGRISEDLASDHGDVTANEQQPITDQVLQPSVAPDQNMQPIVNIDVPEDKVSLSGSENSSCPSTNSSPLSPVSLETQTNPLSPVSLETQTSHPVTRPQDFCADASQPTTNQISANCPVVMRSADLTMSRSDSEDSLPETDCVHEPLLSKRASYTSTSSHGSRKTLTNGQGSDLDDQSSINSYENKVTLLDEDIAQNSKVNGVKMNLTEGHSFGETYFV